MRPREPKSHRAARGASRRSGFRLLSWVAAVAVILLTVGMAWAGETGASAPPVEALEQPVPAAASRGGDTPAAGALERPPVPSDYSTYDGGWIRMAYHPSLAARAQVLREEAEKVRLELQQFLGRPVLQDVDVRIGRTAGEMETLAPKGAGFPRYAAGVAFSELGLVLLTAAPRYPGAHHDLSEVFRHELAHIALHDAVSRENVPRWFNEGFAIHASHEAETSRMQALWTATLSGNLIPFKQITRSFPADGQTASIAYAQAADMVRFLMRGGEEHRFQALIRRVETGQTFDQALFDAYATDMFSLEKGWREDVARRYTFWPVLFGGSLIWVAGFGLLIFGYTKRRKRAAAKMARWAREEAIEDAQRQWAQALLARSGRVRVVVSESGSGAEESKQNGTVISQPVPSIEHEGQRHTLH